MHDDDFALLSPTERQTFSTPIVQRQSRRVYNTSVSIGLCILALLIAFAIFAPMFSPYTSDGTCLIEKNLKPCSHHIFGTDDLGRDMFTRVAVALRISLFIGILAAFLDMTIGVAWGAVAGYLGGMADSVLMRIADFIYCIPYLLAVILVTAIIGTGMSSIITAMCFVGWIQMARLTRAQVMQVKQYDYILATVATGVPPKRIFFRHILPNISGPLLAMLMLTIPHAIFAEAFLSFLGIGIQPPLASLGSMTSDALPALRFYPWRLFIPAGVITVTILSFNLLGDGLRDLLDPKGKKVLNATTTH